MWSQNDNNGDGFDMMAMLMMREFEFDALSLRIMVECWGVGL